MPHLLRRTAEERPKTNAKVAKRFRVPPAKLISKIWATSAGQLYRGVFLDLELFMPALRQLVVFGAAIVF